MSWEDDWAPGNWRHMMIPYKGPSFRIPPFVVDQLTSRRSATTMPAGPLVDKYSVKIEYGLTATEYGHPPGIIEATVKWLPDAYEIQQKRDLLLGASRPLLDEYHSQFAVCPTWTVLNEMQRKINRAQEHMEFVEDRAMRMDRRWREGWRAMHQAALDAFSFDKDHVRKYCQEHAKSSVIPPTLEYGSRKWDLFDEETDKPESQKMTMDDMAKLYESAKGYLEWKLDHWDEAIRMQWLPQAMGIGSRARGPKISSLIETVKAEIPRARKIGYNPYLSTWYAWQPGDSSEKVYDIMTEIGSEMLSCEVKFPPQLGGRFWQEIAEYKDAGYKIVAGDGTGWDNWVTIIVDDYSYGAEEGVAGLVSGASFTTSAGTYTNYMITPDHVQMNHVEAIFSLGDDKLIVLKENAPDDAVKEIPGVWEFDPIATEHFVFLGIMILPEHKGTFAGMNRITIDKGSARIPIKINEPREDIGSSMTDENRAVYKEIMGDGTLQGIPFVDRIARLEPVEFWEGWRTDRYGYLGGVEMQFSTIYDDEFFGV